MLIIGHGTYLATRSQVVDALGAYRARSQRRDRSGDVTGGGPLVGQSGEQLQTAGRNIMEVVAETAFVRDGATRDVQIGRARDDPGTTENGDIMEARTRVPRPGRLWVQEGGSAAVSVMDAPVDSLELRRAQGENSKRSKREKIIEEGLESRDDRDDASIQRERLRRRGSATMRRGGIRIGRPG